MRKTLPALLLGTLGLLAALPSAAARFWMPDPVTERGRIMESLYAKIAVAGIAVFVVVFVLLVYVLWRYRASSGKGRATHEKHRGSLKAEAVWTLIPLAVVMWVGVISYQGLIRLDDVPDLSYMESSVREFEMNIGEEDWALQGDLRVAIGTTIRLSIENEGPVVRTVRLGGEEAVVAPGSTVVAETDASSFDPIPVSADGLAGQESFQVVLPLGITGAQWTWTADYGDGVTVSSSPDGEGNVADDNVFVVPQDIPIVFNVTGAEVIHSFYIQDAGGGPVGMIDANTAGPHRYSHFVVDFPAGEYLVQCKEMCLNPGHAYMRARIHAVPQADFDFWLEKQTLALGARLPEDLAVKASTFGALEDRTVVAGTRLIVVFENDGAGAVTLSATGAGAPATVAPGTTGLFAFDVPDDGTYTLTASGLGDVSFTGLQAQVVTLNLGAFRLEPDHLELRAGTTYLIELTNVHSTVHNLYVGHYGGEVAASSPDLQAGRDASFTWTPTAAGSYDMWCNISGHHGLGMHGTVTVT
ncbi:MAG TPA: cytochrome c oxidase subunit II transmembrane domain-containing protein [Candidatus Thermoplasmatota archaeon]|nr:cytochrome c oxidase subunit II transmembrane domain-containing protein [Candidatus Thermoplasmatota archaeon]